MSDKLLESRLPCHSCGSSDAGHLYEDGFYCFACEIYEPNNTEKFKEITSEIVPQNEVPEEEKKKVRVSSKWKFPLEKTKIKSIPSRKISAEVCEFYDVRTGNDTWVFPFYEDGELIGIKKRRTDEKNFCSEGHVTELWGMHKFPGKSKILVITEGEFDTLAIQTANYKRYNRFFPVVSIGGTSNAKSLLSKNRDWIKQFDECVLWFDNDKQGQKAVDEALKAIGYINVKIAIHPEYKDANEVLMEEGPEEVRNIIWNAPERSPANIVKGENTWKAYAETKDMIVVPWPPFLTKLNDLTYGRWMGSITLIGAGTGIGKSTLLKEDICHLLDTTEDRIGACFLEESIGNTVSDLLSIRLNKRIGLPDVESTEEEEREAWQSVFGDERLLLLDHQGSVGDEGLINKLEYMACSGCKYIYLDHITIAVSDSGNKHQNQAIDSFMSSLLKIVTKHNVWIGVISHLRKVSVGETSFESGAEIQEDDFKGTGSLKQISFQTLTISRNKTSEEEEERHKSRIYLLKDRKTGRTGYAGSYKYNTRTGRLEEAESREDTGFNLTEDFVIEE